MNIKLKLKKSQLEVLLSLIESELSHASTVDHRGVELARTALDAAPNGSSYDIAKLAPIYLQLIEHSESIGSPICDVMGWDEQREWGMKHQSRHRRASTAGSSALPQKVV